MAWDAKKLCTKLSELCQLDIDAVRAYRQAILAVDVPLVRERLESFQEDHERHVMDLSQVIRDFGEEPPADAPDLKGFFLAGFTAVRSMTGTAGALKAMRGNEILTNKTYEEALAWDMPENIRELIERNFDDEVRHLSFIKKAVREKIWERAEQAATP